MNKLLIFLFSIYFVVNYKFFFFLFLSDNSKLRKKKNIELVVSVYSEDINWIKKEKNKYKKITIYCKNKHSEIKKKFSEDNIKIINFTNIGSCDHIYLYHIIHNYENLNDTIYFHKGTENNIKKKYNNSIIVNKIKNKILKKNNNHLKNFTLSDWVFTYNYSNAKYIKSKYNNLEDYLLSLFNKNACDKLFSNSYRVIYGGNFIVSKKNIHRYDKKIYEKLINNEIKNPNRELDHFQERIWGLMFSNCKSNIFT